MSDLKYESNCGIKVLCKETGMMIRKKGTEIWKEWDLWFKSDFETEEKIQSLEQEVARLKEENLKLLEFKKMWQKASPYKVGD